ncbi:MAG: DUF1684 domain-containing protein, partial [Candidatus Auribacterota bacterium]|nr:DUF1684 domain-containing protein [Candidatus Auribacterota bacterium]
MDVAMWKERTNSERRSKDVFLGGFQSPIPFEAREKFTGLDYYPPDPEYRFELEVIEHPDPKNLEIEDTKGNIRDFIQWGEFRFQAKGEDCVLQVYKADVYDDRLFIPFRDRTSGKETY